MPTTSLICFAASYAIALIIELSRLVFNFRWRWALTVGWAAAGLVAHSIYLILQARIGMQARGAILSGWYQWCLIAAWAVAAIYIYLALTRPQAAYGTFLLPMVLCLIGLARLFPKDQFFSASKAYTAWGMIHGLSLLLGTVCVVSGFASGIMYLLHSYRLKKKLPMRIGFALPSLEWLQQWNERSLVLSAFLLGGGVLSGIVLNLLQHDSLPWTDPVVWTSSILFVWLVSLCIFNGFYRPARVGRKVAYLTIANFVFLVLVLAMVLFVPSQHATGRQSVRQRSKPIETSHRVRVLLSTALDGRDGHERPYFREALR